MQRAFIRGAGSHLPPKKLTNKDLEKMLDTSDEWIFQRTGIKERSIAEEGVLTSDISLKASLQALEMAQISPKDLDMILVATITPDTVMPNTACRLQDRLGASSHCMAFDLSAACAGWVYGISIAQQFIKTGAAKNTLVIGAEILHSLVDYTDRKSCILFGDGAGAVVISQASGKEGNSEMHGSHFFSDGSLGDLLVQKISSANKQEYVSMHGREVFKHAVRTMTSCAQKALEKSNFTIEDMDWVIPHQANIRIIESVTQSLKVPPEKAIVEIANMGNTSSSSIPICLHKAILDGRIQRGQKLLVFSAGGGFTAGAMVITY